MQENSIQDSYLNILEMLDQQPGSEQILNSLIKLESDIKAEVFDILQNYQEQNKEVENTKIYQAIHDKNFQLRNTLESRIMQIATGDKICIDDLLNQCIINLNKILENQENLEDVLKKMKIYFRKTEETILPPDEKQIQTGSGNGWIEKKEGYNKLGLLITLLREYGVYTDDLYVVTGVNKSNQMREQSYLYIHIPRIKKTILINNGYGEKTFIYDGYIQVDYFFETAKSGIKQDKNIVGVSFDYENVENWKSKMKYYLFEKQEGGDKPVVGEKIDIKNFLKAPEGWYTNKGLAKKYGFVESTIGRLAEAYRETKPEQFKKYLDKSNHLNGHYSPELCEIIKNRIENRGEKSQEGRYTNRGLAKKYNVAQITVKKSAEKYRETKPERFKKYIDKSNHLNEHYSLELCEIIKKEIENRGEKAPNGRETLNGLGSNQNVYNGIIKKEAEKYRKTNPERFKKYIDKSNHLNEHYSPELCEIIKKEIKNRGEKAPEGWYTNLGLVKKYNFTRRAIKKEAEKYRKTNPERFKKYIDKSNHLNEHYSPELCEIMKKAIENRGEKAPNGWKTCNGLAVIFMIHVNTIKKLAEVYKKNYPEWFENYLDDGIQQREHYSPELCEIIKKEIENRGEKAPNGRYTNRGLSDELNCGQKTIKKITEEYKTTYPEYFKNYLDKMGRKAIHYSPELCEIIRKEFQK